MPLDYTALRTEIQTDPGAIGYAAPLAAGKDQDIADLLNAVQAGATYVVFRNDVSPKEVLDCLASADFAGATALQIAKLQLLLAAGVVDATKANVRGNLQALFSGASAGTIAALTAVVQRQGSRAEKLYGTGTAITSLDVSFALRGKR